MRGDYPPLDINPVFSGLGEINICIIIIIIIIIIVIIIVNNNNLIIAIDDLPIYPKSKVLLYQRYVLSKIS